jgi:hypothetical protein
VLPCSASSSCRSSGIVVERTRPRQVSGPPVDEGPRPGNHRVRLAIRMAEACGLTLVGLLRGRTANVYTHPERIAP